MTKKDYEKIADILNRGKLVGAPYGFEYTPEWERAYKIGARDQWLEAVNGITSILSQDNPRFDRAKFLRACGL